MDIFETCPVFKTGSFIIRLLEQRDAKALYSCYSDKNAVVLMNDDNCDFGFYVDSENKMEETVSYWLDFYKKRYFVRLSILDARTKTAVGTLEGFSGETCVLRLDICAAYEKAALLLELYNFAAENFGAFFGSKILVTKATAQAVERRTALENGGWRLIGKFNGYSDYYEKDC